jgi:hypothetical protein
LYTNVQARLSQRESRCPLYERRGEAGWAFIRQRALSPPRALDSIRGRAQHRSYTNKIGGGDAHDGIAGTDDGDDASLRFGLPESFERL